MRAWYTRLAVALLSISLMQGGLAACCIGTADLNNGARHDSRHTPCSSQPCCSPSFVVQAITPQPLTSWERPQVTDSGTVNLATASLAVQSPVATGAIPAGNPNAIAWLSDDLFVRIHAFRI